MTGWRLLSLARGAPFVAALALTASVASGGCSREERARFDLFDGRDVLVTECCQCLAGAEVPSASEERCVADGDGRECLCGLSGLQCEDELNAEGTGGVRMVGACTQSGGPCQYECEGVLVYPE